MRYILSVLGQELRQQLQERLEKLAPGAEEPMLSILESFERKGIEQGIEQGIERGIEQGQRELVCLQLGRRFGELPAPVQAKIDAATVSDLVRYAERILEAKTLDDVFAD